MTETVMWWTFEFLTVVMEALIFYWFFSKIADQLKSKRLSALGVIVFVGVLSACYYTGVLRSFKLFVTLAASSVMLKLVFEISWKKIVIGIIACVVGTLVSETIVMGIFMSLHGNKTKMFFELGDVRFEAVCIAKIIYIFILLVVARRMMAKERKYERREIMLFVIQMICYVITIIMAMEVAVAEKTTFDVPGYFFSALAVGCMISYLVSIRLIGSYFESQRAKEELMRMQAFAEKKKQYYEMKQEAEKKVQRMYHDINKHISAMEAMQTENLGSLQEYMGEVKEELTDYEKLYDTGNDVIDWMLMDKRTEAEKKDISFRFQSENGCLRGLTIFALCTVFANILDNAIEAAVLCEESERYIKGKVCEHSDGVLVCFENSYRGERVQKGSRLLTTKRNKKEHGIGMDSVDAAVKRLGGRMNYGFENGVFSIMILLKK